MGAALKGQALVEIRVADDGVAVSLFCGCGQLLGVDYTAAVTPDEVAAADRRLSDKLMRSLIRRVGGATCPSCGACATAASAADPQLQAVV